MVHLIAPIFGLVAFFGVVTASKYSSGSESSVSYGAGTWSSWVHLFYILPQFPKSGVVVLPRQPTQAKWRQLNTVRKIMAGPVRKHLKGKKGHISLPVPVRAIQIGTKDTMTASNVSRWFLNSTLFRLRKFSHFPPECNAKYGQLPSTTTTYESPTETASYNGGATHTIIVAPTQGVLRYVPFATNASTGDTIKFMWGANNHTVTKSSALLPCNKSSARPFASGTQNKDFVCTFAILFTSHNVRRNFIS